MKRVFTIFLSLIVILTGCIKQTYIENDAVKVYINRNVETLFIIYSIADLGITTFDESFIKTATKEFYNYKNHKSVRIIEQFVKENGVDALPKLFLFFTELPDFQLKLSLDSVRKSNKLTSKYENLDGVTQVLAQALKDFYTDANVENFILRHNEIYSNSLSDVYKNLPSNKLIKSMEQFYGFEHEAYVLIPSPMLFPTWGFGGSTEVNGKKIVYNIFGPLRVAQKGNKKIIDFDSRDKIRNISVHEFGHSFVNPIAEKTENRELINSYSYLFEPIRDDLTKQGYNNWWTCVVEHLVRLGEIRISEAMDNKTNAKLLRENYTKNKSFIYLPLLERKIVEYENNRDKYSTFEEFLPELIKAFSEIQPNK